MRVIVTGGGTGGHIFPAIAIADKIKEMEPDSDILYIGNEVGLEKDLVPATGYPFKMVVTRWFDKNPLELMKTGFVVTKGIFQALKIMKEFKPEVVVGTGGYACVPVVFAGKIYGARCYIHEQNAYPGKANRVLERAVKKIFLGFPEAGKVFKNPAKHVPVGNPVRKRFFEADRVSSRKKLGIPENDFVIFSFGGSQGAERINDTVYDLVKKVNGEEGITYVFGTGDLYYEEIMEKLEKDHVEIKPNVIIKAYMEDIQNYLAASDVIISRAGALSVAEITVCGKASILIPSPNVTNNHQYFNAKSVADKGGAVLLEEKDLTPEKMIEEVMKIRNNPSLLKSLTEGSRSCAPVNATDLIYAEIKKDER